MSQALYKNLEDVKTHEDFLAVINIDFWQYWLKRIQKIAVPLYLKWPRVVSTFCMLLLNWSFFQSGKYVCRLNFLLYNHHKFRFAKNDTNLRVLGFCTRVLNFNQIYLYLCVFFSNMSEMNLKCLCIEKHYDCWNL